MSIRDNLRDTFKVKAETETYVVADGITVGRGDLLHIVKGSYSIDMMEDIDGGSSGKTYEVVTNVIGDEDTVDAIAIHTADSKEKVECYVLVYRTKYRNLNNFPHIVLEQFTHEEIRKKKISTNISASCNAISKVPCNLISRYSCDNLNTFGVRIK